MKKFPMSEQEGDFEGIIMYDFSKVDATVFDKLNFKEDDIEAQIAQILGEAGTYTFKKDYIFRTDSGTFQLRGDDFEKHVGLEAKIKGKILSETIKNYLGERIQVLEVYEIQLIKKEDPTDEELKPYTEGPFLGRLFRPDVFGENPDLYGEMTKEQMQKLLYPDEEE